METMTAPLDVPRIRYLLTPPGDTRPSLLVQLCPHADEALDTVRRAMLDLGCANGLVLDAEQCVVLHDAYESTELGSIKIEACLDTQRLLGPPDRSIELRLERWLADLTENWTTAVPREDWAKPLLMDVVPAASGTEVHRSSAGARV